MFTKKILIISLSLLCYICQGQKPFNVLPDISGGDRNQLNLLQVIADSTGITCLGEQPKFKNGDSTRYVVNPLCLRFDYEGNFLFSKTMEVNNPVPLVIIHNPFIKKNDSISLYYTYGGFSDIEGFGVLLIIELNTKTCDIISKKNLRVELKNDHSSRPKSGCIDNKGNIYLSNLYRNDPLQYSMLGITKLDKDYNILWNDTFPDPVYMFAPKYIDVNENGVIEIMGTAFDREITLPYVPFYIKIDSNRLVQKLIIREDLPFTSMAAADNFAANRENDGSWILEMDEDVRPDINYRNSWYSIPRFYKFSREFDTIIWQHSFYDGSFKVRDSIYGIKSAVKCIDGSGYIATGDLLIYAPRRVDRGVAFKVSPQGDSLWMRKYLPIGFDTSRMTWEYFYPITSTPYNTYVVCGYYWDKRKNGAYPWLVHMDVDGCIVPGCNEVVNTKDIMDGKAKAFEIYPNPALNDKLYLLSRITTNQDAQISIIDLQGKVIKSMTLKFEKDAQYFVDIPADIPNGEYILKIHSAEHNANEKLILSR